MLKSKILFSFIFLIGCIHFVYTQKVNVKLGPIIKFDRTMGFPSIVHSASDKYYLWATKYVGLFSVKTEHNLMILDKKFELDKTIEFNTTEKNIYHQGVFWFKKQIAWCTAEYDKKAESITYKITPIDLNGQGGKTKKLAKFTVESRRDIPTSSWVFNTDTTRLLFIAQSDNDSRKEPYQAYFSISDTSLNTAYSKTIKFTATERQTKLLSSAVNGKNEAYFLYKIYEDKIKESKKNKPAYDIQLLSFMDDKNPARKIELKLDNSFINSAHIKFRNDAELYCVGLYSNTKNGVNHGIFFMKIVDGQIVKSNKRSFTDADLKNLGKDNTEKDKSGEEGINDEFTFRNFEILGDGSVFLTIEPNYYVVYRTNRSVSTTYYSEDIIVINISSEGEVEDINILPKNQRYGETSLYLSHTSFKDANQMYIFYNEDEDNYKKPVGSKPRLVSNINDFVGTLTTIDKSGKFNRQAIFSHEDTDCVLLPKQVAQIGPKTFFIQGQKRKMLSLGNQQIFGKVTVE